MSILTNEYGLPQSLVNAIANDQYDGPRNDLSVISVTTLISPPKIRMLRHRHQGEITEDVSQKVWILLGQSVHSILERAESGNDLVEQRLTMQVGDRTVSGKTDLYNEYGVISDYKVTSTWAIVFSPEGKKEWIEQLNCLALLYRNAGFEVKKLQIVAILRDWSAANAKKGGDYPKIPVVVVDIPLWSKCDQEAFVHQRVMLHRAAEGLIDDTIPACTSEERWQTQTKFAVMKNDNKRADKVFDDLAEANEYMAAQDQKHAWKIDPVGRHPILALHHTQCDGVIISSFVSHDTD